MKISTFTVAIPVLILSGAAHSEELEIDERRIVKMTDVQKRSFIVKTIFGLS